MDKHSKPSETINSIYELPSIEPNIRYLHTSAGFPTKSTWIKYIYRGNDLKWPLINTKNVTNPPPEYEETQKGAHEGKKTRCHIHQTSRTGQDSKQRKKNNKQHEIRQDILIV